jgi:uncharacterized protein YdhG (YjbR/CyaY superfamily)
MPLDAVPPTQQIAASSEPARGMLERLYSRARAIAPTAEEGTSYGMPALRYRGRPLISVVETKAGYSVFPFSPAVVESVLPFVAGFSTTKGGIRFTDALPIPDAAFDGLVSGRVAEIDEALGR